MYNFYVQTYKSLRSLTHTSRLQGNGTARKEWEGEERCLLILALTLLKCEVSRGGNASQGLAAVLACAGLERAQPQPQPARAPSVKRGLTTAFADVTCEQARAFKELESRRSGLWRPSPAALPSQCGLCPQPEPGWHRATPHCLGHLWALCRSHKCCRATGKALL